MLASGTANTIETAPLVLLGGIAEDVVEVVGSSVGRTVNGVVRSAVVREATTALKNVGESVSNRFRMFAERPSIKRGESAAKFGHTMEEAEHLVPSGSVGSVRAWTTKARLKTAKLPIEEKIRFVPDAGYHPSEPLLRGPKNGYLDRFGNEWVKGPSRTPGQPFEWDVQLSSLGRKQLGWASRDGSQINISLDGKFTHR